MGYHSRPLDLLALSVWIPSGVKPSDAFDVTVYWVAEAVD
jgi:hypothetical protein